MHSEHFPSGRPKLQRKRLNQILTPAGKEHFSHCGFLYPSHYILRVNKICIIGKIFVTVTYQSHKLKPRFSHRIIKFFLSPTSGCYTSRDPEFSKLQMKDVDSLCRRVRREFKNKRRDNNKNTGGI